MVIVCDLDGVVWLAGRPIDGAADAIASLRAGGHTVAFASNFSDAPASALIDRLSAMGIDAGGHLVTAAMAAASLLHAGERALVFGGPGTVEAVEGAGVAVVDAAGPGEPRGPFDAVVIGYRQDLAWDHVRRASTAVRNGARLIATGTDATYPTPEGLVPGNGAAVAAIATAAGRSAVVAGKPHEPMAELIRERYGPSGWMVGDRPETDGAFARTLGYGWALVLTGVVSAEDLPVVPVPDVVAPTLSDVARLALAGELPDPACRTGAT